MKFLYPRGCSKSIWRIVLDEYDTYMKEFCLWLLRKQLERPLNYLEVEL